MIIPVHTITRKTIIAEFGSDCIHIDTTSPLLPLMTSKPVGKKTDLNDEITLTGDPLLLAAIRIDAGHNLYLAHMHQLIEWISKSVALDRPAWTAMMEYYRVIGLDIDDLPPERTYKRWQRHTNRKNRGNKLYHEAKSVLKIITPRKGGLNDCLDAAGRLIQEHPDMFLTSGGDPDRFMIQKAIMYTMNNDHGWDQIRIAHTFGMTQPAVSKHIRSFSALLTLQKRSSGALVS